MASFLDIRKKYTEEKKTETGTDKQTGGSSTGNTASGKGGAAQRGFYTPDPTKPISFSPTAPVSNQGGVDIPPIAPVSNQGGFDISPIAPWRKHGGVDIPSTAGQRFVADVTAAANTVQEQEAPKVDPKTGYEQAQKEYDDYVNSDEYKAKRNQNSAAYANYLQQGTGISTFPVAATQQQYKIEGDETEKQLRAKRDYYKAEMDKEEDRKTYEAGVKEIEALSPEDKQLLSEYVVKRAKWQIGWMTGRYTIPFYLYNNPIVKKYGYNAVRRMAETYERMQAEKSSIMVSESTAKSLEGKWGIGANIASVGANLVGGIASMAGRSMELYNRTGQYKYLQKNTAFDIPSIYAGTVRQVTADKISGGEDGGIIREGLSIGYQGVMSAADSMTRAIVAGPAAPVLAASGAFSQAVGEASAQGATPTQAVIYGLGIAGIEAATEKIPLDEMMKAAKGGMSAAKAMARQALSEATEEEISFFAGLLWEAALLQGKASYQQKIGEAVANGMGYAEAKAQADKEIWMEALHTAMVSSIAGGISGAATSTYGNATAAQEGTQSQQKPETKTEAQTEGKQETPAQTTEQPVAAQDGEAQAQTPTAQTGIQTAAVPQEQPVAAAPMQTPDIQNAVQGVVQGLNQRQQAEAEARAEQARTREAIAQGMAEEYGPMMPQEAPKSQMQQDVDNATAAGLAEQGIGEQAVQVDQEARAAQTPTQEIAENQGIKGTGAAEQNFSGKASYQDLLYDGNVQPDREGDVRPMEVPKKDAYGRDVSETVANLYGAEITPDSMANAIEELVQEGALGFDRRSNQDALNDAAKEIEKKGAYSVRKRINGNVANGKIKDGDIEAAMLLYSQYANKNGKQAMDIASELMVDLTTMAHMTGRNLQLFKLLRRMTPEGQAMTVRRVVEQNVDSMIRSGKAKSDSDVKINEQLLEDYKKAAAENARAVSPEQKYRSESKMLEIQQAIMADAASQIKSTFKAKWDAWRYMAMLGNVKTQVRNFFGNMLFVPYKEAKDLIGAAFEKFIPKEQRTKSLTTDFELLAWARQDRMTDAVHDALAYTGKLGDDATSAKFNEQVKVFDSGILEGARKLVSALPSGADMLFKNGYYAKSLAGFLRARGYKLEDVQSGKVSEAVMAEARGYAINEAMKATFNDCNAFSDMVSNLRFDNPDTVWKKVANMAGESILPFRRTPANVLVRFAEYSPAGLVKGVWDMATKVHSGKLSAAAAIDQITSGLTGSGIAALGYFLAAGIGGVKLTSGGTDEDEKRQGHQYYALEFSINGQTYSYKIDWAPPANLPLFLGASLYNAMNDSGADTSISALSRIWQGTKNVFEPMLQLSCLSSLNDFFEGIRYAPEGEAVYSAVADVATGYFMQGIPALLRQSAQAAQQNKQTTFANDPDPLTRELQGMGAQVPFFGSRFQTDKRNAWGETETTENPVLRAFNAFVNPGTLKPIDNSAVEQEISRLGKAQTENVTPPDIPKKISYTDNNGETHKDYRLTEEQYQKIAVTQGQTAYRIVENLVNSDEYKGLTDTQKAYAIRAAYEYAQEKGKQAAIPNYYSEASAWISETEETDTKAFIARGARLALDNAIGNAVNAINNRWNVTPAAKSSMEGAYDGFTALSPEAQERVLEDADSSVVNYIDTRNAGGTTQNYLDAVGNVQKLGEGAKTVDKWGAVAATKGLKPDVADALMKAYMTDYDPDSESPNKTEPKYDYMRHKMGMTTEEYVEAMRVYYEVKDIPAADLEKDDTERKDVYLERWQDTGLTPEEANELYYLLVGYNSKQGIDVIDWYNNWSGVGNTETETNTGDSNVPWYLRYR